MQSDILDLLEDAGYEGPLLEETVYTKELEAAPQSVEYTKVIEWATKELAALHGLEDYVNAITDVSDSETFMMELSGFIREYGCPYTELSSGPITQRLSNVENKERLLLFLLTELQAARMTAVNKPQLMTKNMDVDSPAENETAKYLKILLVALGFPKPPEGITAFQLFSKVEGKVKELLGQVQSAYLSKPLLKARLSDKQWESVIYINQVLTKEYECRREMLLKRLDVTVQSFKWSDKGKEKEDKLAAIYQPIRRELSRKVVTDHAALLAAREDLLNIEKTSSGTAREKTKCALNRVLIGKVPDRGGRAYEMQPPPPEMPSFQARKPGEQRGYDRGGGGGYGKRPKRGRQY